MTDAPVDAFAGRFLLGVNYWSRAGGPRMWDRFDPIVVERELSQMRAIGLDCCRAFAFVPSFVPQPPAVDPGALARFAALVTLAEKTKIELLPTALVGHMSGENFDFPGQAGRSLYGDPELVEWQRALVGELARAAGNSPSIAAWVLSNEMPLWAGAGAPAEIEAWCRALTSTIRARSPGVPIGGGDGVMASFPTAVCAPHFDYLAPHVYYADADPLRQAWQIDLSLRSLERLGRPLLLEEFGCSSTHTGEAEQAAYFREAIFAAFGVGARGAIGWCFSDFDPETLGRETPYSHHAFELGFGVTRKDGSEKPVCDELRAARALLDGLSLGRLRRPAARAAIVRPRYLDEDFPFSWQDREAMRRTLLQSYVLACQAGLDPQIIAEGDDLAPYALLLCPSTQKLTTPTWLALEKAARAGATVYWSYFGGDHNFHQGPWCPNFAALTGCRHRLRYGCFDLPPETVTLSGALALSVPTRIGAAPAPYPLARVPIEPLDPASVRVLATDGEDRPALIAHPLERGRVMFCSYPLERYLANLSDGSSRGGHRLYALLGEAAGLAPRYPSPHPDVQVRVLEDGADDLVLAQHRGWAEAVPEMAGLGAPIFSRGASSGALGPKAVTLHRVRARPAGHDS